MQNIQVRPATEADLEAIALLHLSAARALTALLPAGFGKHFLSALPEPEQMIAEFRERLEDTAGALVLIAEYRGLFAGYLTSAIEDYSDELLSAPFMTIEYIVVRPEACGKGVGAELIRAAEAAARARGITQVDLLVWSDNLPARALYRRLGYSVIEERMAKRLDREKKSNG
jgi:ribosomal protein S18 acetylase RimI-like enzyme